MSAFDNSRWHILLALLIAAALISLYAVTAPPGLTWEHGGVDGGELALASARLGVAHPPGYGLYTLLGALFVRLPLPGTPIQHMQILSHLLALLSCALTGLTAWRLAVENALPLPNVIGLTAALALGLSRTFWSQAIIAEVYTLSLAFFCAGLLLSFRWSKQVPSPRSLFAGGFLLGMAATHHLTTVLWLPGLLWLARTSVLRWHGWRWAALIVGGVLGLWPWLWLMLRGGAEPAANWGNVGVEDGLSALWAHITGQQYNVYLNDPTPGALINGIGNWVKALPTEFTWFGVALLVVGLVIYGTQLRGFLVASLLWCILLAGFSGLYEAENTANTYTLPLMATVAVWMGFGLVGVVELVGKWWLTAPAARAVMAVALTGGLALALAVVNGPAVDVRNEREPYAFAQSTFAALPENTLVLTELDTHSFTLWYYQFVEGMRPDLAVVDRRLLRFDWYRDNVARLFPDLAFEAASSREWLDQAMAAVASGGTPRPIADTEFTMPPAGRQSRRAGDWYLLIAPNS